MAEKLTTADILAECERLPVTRIDAESTIAPLVEIIDGANSIPVDAALVILGGERHSRLLADPIRKLGPRPGYIYAWNVADYLQHPDLRKDKDANPVKAVTDWKAEAARLARLVKRLVELLKEVPDPQDEGYCDECGKRLKLVRDFITLPDGSQYPRDRFKHETCLYARIQTALAEEVSDE